MRRPSDLLRRCALAMVLTAAAAFIAAATAVAAGPPVVSSPSANEVQGVSALLRGAIAPEGLATTYHFEYIDQAGFEAGGANGFANAAQTPTAQLESASETRAATAAISGLTRDTTYHYRLIAQNSAGPTTGAEGTFTTFGGFGFLPGTEGFNAVATEENGSIDDRAGSHPYALTTDLNFNMAGESNGTPSVPVTDGDVRDLHIDLPPGMIENPTAVPQCSQSAFQAPRQSPYEEHSHSGESCPDRTQIGVVAVRSSYAGGSTRWFGVFNLEPPPGAPSEIGFNPYGSAFTFIPHVRETGREYGITLDALNIPQQVDISGIELTLWGAPWDITHNPERGDCLNEGEPAASFGKCSIGPPALNPAIAYLTLPTTCASPMVWTARATSWQQPGTVTSKFASHYNQGPPVNLTKCSSIPFGPKASAVLTNPRATSPSGLNFDIKVDTLGLLRRKRLAPSPVKTAVVEMPEGVTVNPSVGSGLGVCTPAQYGAETFSSPPGAGCPNQAKIGDFTVKSPLFDEPIAGSIYLAAPHDNPFDSLLGLYLVAKAPERGILVKVAGELTPDQNTGRLTATFQDLPQIPYSDLEIHFREGQRSPIATPSACGSSTIGVDLSPWLKPAAVLHSDSPLSITSGVGGGACPQGTPPFNPQAQAGSLNSNAGSYTPFYLHLTRKDNEQEITSYSATLPPGLTGKLAGIPYCPDANIEAAKKRGGFEEAEQPSCPAGSRIGHTVAGYGLGSVLAYAPGNLYLAGPFHGSTFSIVAIDSATVGPFDLGVVVVRSAIHVDPQSAQVSIDSAGSDPIPHIIDGIPIHLRDIRVYISRPEFTLNPTDCEPFTVSSQLNGSGAGFSDPADDVSATATSLYQVSNCGALRFKPRLSLKLRGGTRRGDYPSLRAELRPRPGDANIAGAAVALPPSEFLAQEHIGTICTRPQYAREVCPAESVYGTARAFSPLLGEPLEGKVYLRSSDNTLPDLVTALRGGGLGLKIDVVGRIDSLHGGLRATFDTLPDAPVSKFVMTLKGGKRGLLVNSEEVCEAKRPATARFTGKNGVSVTLHPRVTDPKCGKKSGKAKRESRRKQ
jgi:hypothetical protein